MRYLVVLTVIFLSCGRGSNSSQQDPSQSPRFSLTVDSTSDLPTCGDGNARQLIYLVSEQKFMHCFQGQWQPIVVVGQPGPRGEPGAKGERGDALALGGYGLYDANNQLIGYPDSPSISSDADRYVMFVDGLVGQIRASTGQVLLGDSSCYYETADCTKSCYSINGPTDPVGNHLLERVSDKRLVYVPFDAVSEGEFFYHSRWSGGQCEAVKGVQPKHFVTREWLPQGLVVPLHLPLKVRLLRQG